MKLHLLILLILLIHLLLLLLLPHFTILQHPTCLLNNPKDNQITSIFLVTIPVKFSKQTSSISFTKLVKQLLIICLKNTKLKKFTMAFC